MKKRDYNYFLIYLYYKLKFSVLVKRKFNVLIKRKVSVLVKRKRFKFEIISL